MCASIDGGGVIGTHRLVADASYATQELSAKINRSIEQQVATAASSGKLTIMKNVAMEG